jgi:nitroreductase
MDFSQLLQDRKSIRKFTNQPIEPEKIERLTSALLLAPSSKASFPSHFYLVKDRFLISKLADCKPHGATFLKEAPLIVVVCADPSISDVWIEDASIATTFLMLETVDLGLGGCWVQVRNRNHNEQLTSSVYVKETLNIDQNLEVLALYGIGYPDNSYEKTSQVNYSPVTIIG